MCGSFGWGVYRIETDRGGSGGSLFRVTSAMSNFSAGAFDHKGVMIPTDRGALYYGFDKTIDEIEGTVEALSVPRRAVVLGWEAVVDSRTGSVTIYSSDGATPLQLPSQAHTVVSVSGNFWIATSNGVHVYGTGENGEFASLGHVQLAGPVLQLIPLFDGSVAFVSESGFVGVVEPVQPVVAFEQ